MHTTNTASRALAVSYTRRAKECAHIHALAEELAAIATRTPCFLDDQDFIRLEADYRTQLAVVLSLPR